MAQNDSEICRSFVAGDPLKRSLIRRVRGERGGFHSHLVDSSIVGLARLAYFDTIAEGVTKLMSYERFYLAIRIQKKNDAFFVLNADTAILGSNNRPSMTTNAQQREIREAIKRAGVSSCLLPFSALDAASIHRPEDIEIVHTTTDTEVTKTRKVKDRLTGEVSDQEYTRHFLGETLFRYGGRLYISGLDRNDDPSKRKFYLARLPEKARPKTVEAALLCLRPKNLPETALRQGEWFFVLADVKPKKEEIVREHLAHAGSKTGVPILHAEGKKMRDDMNTWAMRNRSGRHVATRVYTNGAVFVSGMVRDVEHNALKLGNGKQWFRVVRNLATGSWAADGTVD